MPNKNGQKQTKANTNKGGGERKRCVAEGRRKRTHAWRLFLSEVRESMKGHLRLRKNSRKSITERSGDLVLLARREEASGPPFPAR